MEELCNDESFQGQENSNVSFSNSSRGRSGTNGPHIEAFALKSNLKRSSTTTTVFEENQSKTEKRKVSWPDHALGKDIAHVHEFEPSMSEDGELEGVRNSCICTIQ